MQHVVPPTTLTEADVLAAADVIPPAVLFDLGRFMAREDSTHALQWWIRESSAGMVMCARDPKPRIPVASDLPRQMPCGCSMIEIPTYDDFW